MCEELHKFEKIWIHARKVVISNACMQRKALDLLLYNNLLYAIILTKSVHSSLANSLLRLHNVKQLCLQLVNSFDCSASTRFILFFLVKENKNSLTCYCICLFKFIDFLVKPINTPYIKSYNIFCMPQFIEQLKFGYFILLLI